MDFADNLRQVRKEQSLSQQDLAIKLNVAQSTVSMWEAGRRTPKLQELNHVARVLKITVARLIKAKKEKKVEIIKNEVYIDGTKVSELDPSDVEGIVKHIDSVKNGKAKKSTEEPPKLGTKAKKILIIDDEQEICEMLYSFLVPHNYKVFLAFNGQMGLEYFEEVKPDIVLLDLRMSDIDGVEVLKIIRKVSDVPVVIITGHAQEVSEIHLADLKIEGYIEKPIRLGDVLNTLKHLVGE